MLVKDVNGYSPGPRLAVLGAQASQRDRIRGVSAPYLQDLFERSRAVIWLVELDPWEQLTLITSVFDRTSLPYSNDWPFARSLAEPRLLATALGRVVLAHHPNRVEDHLQRGVQRLTRHTATHPRQVRAAIARATDDGMAVEHEQVRIGWSCLAMPIAVPGSANAVLGLVDRTPRFEISRLRQAAQTVAAGIGKEWRNNALGRTGAI